MPLSRLENFIKNVEGTILYVNPTDQDATDSIENQGNSLTRPFKTIQRALIEAARFSFVAGKDNDKFDKTTIIVYPGVHKIDNRPGLSIDNNGGSAEYKDRFGNVVSFSELTSSSNFDIEDSANVLHHFNSVNGGVIIPRGTSLVGMDLRKTKIFPMFVPDPQNSEIDRTAIFRVTGGCYFWQFSLFDGDPNGTVYKNYSTTRFTPNFSHHKLTCFEYADGNNTISLGAVTGGSAISNDNTDLDSYYFKVANAYGSSSGREIPSWPTNEVLQPKLAENQIVGAVQADPIGITSVFSTNQTDYTFSGSVGRNIVVTTTNNHNLNVGTPIIVSGITTSSTATSNDPTFNAEGGTVVAEVLSSTQFAFVASEDTVVTNPHLSGDETVQVEPDTVTGASPYIFNLSLRSVYGVNGLHADGSKATGFKSMVLAQFTGIGLQKDDNAFLLYNESTGTYNDTTTVAESEKPLHINSKAIYKRDYETVHVKASNSAILQCVSIFAIGFSQHFVADTGGDQSITNSNSNFGAKALIARGFRDTAFARDNSGYITHVIPPKNVTTDEESNFWVPLNVGLTTEYTVGAGTSNRLYTFGYTDQDVPPTHIIDQFRIGSKVGDQLKLEVNNQTKTAEIIMEGSSTATNQKVSFVNKNTAGTANSITESSGSIFGLTGNHEFDDGETVRILSDDGTIPDGIELDQKYFVIKTGLNGDQIKLAKTFNEAVSSITNPIENVNTTGGSLRIISAVSDKFPGDAGHPLQYDDTRSNWYINVKGDSTNKIYEAIEDSTTNVTSKSFISRKSDNRNLEDRIYKIRYVIPKEFQNAKPPAAGYVIQESSSTIVENQSEYSGNISNLTDFRNLKIIHDVNYDSNAGVATVTAELPHRLASGAKVKLNKVSSTNNTLATAKKGFNGIFDVASIVDSKTFTINIPSGKNPGTFLSNRPASVTDRDENHPNFSINEYSEVYYIYRVNEISEYQQDIQDGIYHLTCLLGSINPSSSYFSDRGFSQNVVNLYPMLDRDNYTMDPSGALSIASNKRVSEVTTGDLTQSITKEFVNSLLTNNRYGFNITDAVYDQTTGITTVTTDIQHNLNSVINVSIADSGSGYGFSGVSTTVYNAKLTGGTGEGATIRFTTNTGGNFSLTSPIIVDGGSGYSVGDTLTISNVGIPTFSGGGVTYSEASLTVTSINQASENSIQIEDVIDNGEKNNEFNGVFRILDVPTSKKVSFLLPPLNSGIGTFKKNGKFILAGSLSTITSIEYTDATTGIVTVTCDSPHGFNIGNSFKIDYNNQSSLTNSIYNGTFTVNERVGLNTFTFYIGQGISTAAAPSNVGYVLPTGYTAQEADSDISRENIFRRMNSFYVGISTTINGALTKSSTTLTLSNSFGFEKGDYIEIGTEIVRVKNTFSSNQADILRGLFGTRVAAITDGTLAKKIRPIPVEGRRYSILRASGHTFEYVGFGPGNYSNALPQRQDRILDKTEQLLSQSEKSDGGVVVYTGMNDSGDFYVGNRRLSSATGQEETIGIPVPRFVGDDGADTRLSVVFDDVTVKEFIKVEGGAGNIITSEFNGPVAFSNKVNFNSNKGADFKTITLKGTDAENTRRKYSVGISTPKSDADNSVGDVVWKNDPVPGGYAGWIFAGEEGTEDNKWRKFGLIASEDAEQDTNTDSNINSPLGNFTILPSKIGINTNIPQSIVEVKDGNTRLDTLYVAGVATFIDSVTLATVNIDDLTVNDSLSVSGTVSVNASGGYTLCGNSKIIGLTTHTGNYDLVGGLQVENSASVGGTLTVSGNTDLNQNLQVSGNTSIGGALSVSGITTLGSNLNVSGSLSLNGSSILSGAVQAKTNVSVGQNLDVGNNASVGGTLTVTGNTSVDGGLTVSGATNIKNTLTVSGVADLNQNLQVSGNTQLSGTLQVTGESEFQSKINTNFISSSGQLQVDGTTSLKSSLYVSGATSLHSFLDVRTNTHIGGTLCVGGNTQLKGNASVGGTLGVNGTACIGGNTQLKSNASVGQNLRVSGNACVGGTLSVGGNTSLGGTLYVNSDTQLNGSLSVNNGVTIGGGLNVSGESEFQGKISANQISASGQITSDQQVQADNQVTAGQQVTAGADVIAGGTLQVASTACIGGNTQLKSNASVGGTLDVNGQTSIGGNLKVSNDGNANIEVRSNLSGVPHIDFARSVDESQQDFGARLILRGDDQFDISGANVRIGQNLQVAGSTSLDDALTVSGPTTIKNTLTVSGNTDLNRNLQVSGNTDIGGYLNVGGATTLQQTLFVSGNASIGGTLCVEGQAFFNSDINISGNSLFTGRIDVSGDAMLNRTSGITTTRDLDVNGNLDASGLVCAGTLRVAGTTSLENLDVNGSASFASSVKVEGNTSLNGTLEVTGLTSLQGGLVVDTSMDVQTKLNANQISASGQLQVDGTTSLKGSLYVSGATSLHSFLDVRTNTHIGGTLCVGGNTQLKGNASVGGTLSVAQKLTALSGVDVSGGIALTSELDFIHADNKYIDMMLVSSDSTKFTGNIRSMDHNSQNHHTHIAFVRGGAVQLAYNNNTKAATTNTGFYVSGNLSATSQVIAGQQVRAGVDVIAGGTLQVAGSACIGGNTQLKSNTSVGGTLRVNGLTSLQGGLVVDTFMDVQTKLNADDISSSGALKIGSSPNPHIELESSASGTPYIDFSRHVNGQLQDFGARLILRGDDQFDISGANVRIGQNLQVDGNTSLDGDLTVSGESDFQAKLNANQISASGQITSDQQVQADGMVTAGQNVTAGNDIFAGRNLNVSGSACVGGDTQLKSNTSVGQTLRVGGSLCAQSQAFVNQDLRVSGATQLKSNASVGGTLSVKGLTTLSGGLTITNGDLTVQVESFFNEKLNANLISASGQITSDQQVQADNQVTAGQQVTAGANVTAGQQVTAGANVTAGQQVTAGADVIAGGTLQVAGSACVDGDTQLKSNASVGGTLSVAQKLTALSGVSVNGGIALTSELDFNRADNKYIDMMLISSDQTTFTGNIRSMDHQSQNHETHIAFKRNEGVCFFYNSNRKAETTNTGFYVSGNLSATSQVIAGQQVRAGGALHGGSLHVAGNASIGGNTQLRGNASVGGTLRVFGSLCAQAQAFVNQDLRVTGNTTLSGTLAVTGGICGKGGLILAEQENPRIELRSNTSGSPYIDFSRHVDGSQQDFGARIMLPSDNELELHVPSGNLVLSATTVSVQGQLAIEQSLQVAGMTSLQGGVVIDNSFDCQVSAQFNQISSSGQLQVQGKISAGGDLTVGGTLTVSGVADLNQNLQVSGNTQLKGNASVGGTLSVNSTLTVQGETELKSKLSANAISASSQLQVQGQISTAQQLQVGGQISAVGAIITSQNLHVAGTACIGGNAQLKSNASVGQTLRVGGTTCLQSQVFVNQSLQIRDELDFIGGSNKYIDMMLVSSDSATFTGNIRSMNNNAQGHETHIAFKRNEGVCFYYNNNGKAETTNDGFRVIGTLNVNQQIHAGGAGLIGGNLHVAGKVSATGQILTGGNLSAGGFVRAGGNLCANGSLRVTAASQLQGGLTVKGTAIMNNGLTVNGAKLKVDNGICGSSGLHIAGNASFGSTLKVAGNAQLTGGLIVQGGATISGGLTSINDAAIKQALYLGGNQAKHRAFACRHFGRVRGDNGSVQGGSGTFSVQYNNACTGKYNIKFNNNYQPSSGNYSVNVTTHNTGGDHIVDVDNTSTGGFRVRGIDTGITGGAGNSGFDDTGFMFSVFY